MRPTAAALVAALAARGQTLATAESCTGGLLSAAVVDIPGASAVFAGGVVSYTDAVKTAALGVDGALLSAFGAVSAEVACAMARGARERLGTDYGISTTGLAGPGGGTAETPVGTVFIGLSSDKEERAVCLHLPGLDRDGVRQQTVERALEIMLAFLGEDVL